MRENKDFKHGTPAVWDEIFDGVDVVYSDSPQTQNQLFEHMKISYLSEIFPQKKSKLLEVGCGSAFVSLYFAKKGWDVTSLDVNKSIIEIAKNNFEKQKAKGTFLVGNAEKLTFKDNEFDVVTSFGLMEHFINPEIAIKEMVRVTKKGGIFFADIVPNRFSCQTFGNIFNFFASFFFGIVKGNPKKGFEKGMRNFRPLYFEADYSWQKYKKIIEEAGIKTVTVKGNRPFPRLTLPLSIDKIYASIIKLFKPFWTWFDRRGRILSKYYGAGLWFWGEK